MDWKEDKTTNKFCNVGNKNCSMNDLDDVSLKREKPKKGVHHKIKHKGIDKKDTQNTIQTEILKLEDAVSRRKNEKDRHHKLDKEIELKKGALLKYYLMGNKITLLDESCSSGDKERMRKRKYKLVAHTVLKRDDYYERKLSKSKQNSVKNVPGTPVRCSHKSEKEFKYVGTEDGKTVVHRDTAVNNVEILYVSPISRCVRENHTTLNDIQSSAMQERQLEDKLLKKVEERIGICKTRDYHTATYKSMVDIKEFEKRNSYRVYQNEKTDRQKENLNIDRQTYYENNNKNHKENDMENKLGTHNHENDSSAIASVDAYNTKTKVNCYKTVYSHLPLKNIQTNSRNVFQSAEYNRRHNWNLDKEECETPKDDKLLKVNKGNIQFFDMSQQKIEQYKQCYMSPLNECSTCYPENNNFINSFTSERYCGITNVHVKQTSDPLRQEVSFSSLNIVPNKTFCNKGAQFYPSLDFLPEKEINTIKFKNSENFLKECNNKIVASKVITESDKQFYEQYNSGIEKLKKSDASGLIPRVSAENILERILKASTETGTLSFTVTGIEPPIILNRRRKKAPSLSNKVLQIALLPVVSFTPKAECQNEQNAQNVQSTLFDTSSNSEGKFILSSPTVNNLNKAGTIEYSSSSNVIEVLPSRLENITKETYSECSVGKAIYVESNVKPQEEYSSLESKDAILEEIINRNISKELEQTKQTRKSSENIEDSYADEGKHGQISLHELRTWEEHIVNNIIEGLKKWKLPSNNQNGTDTKEIVTEMDGNEIALNSKCSSNHIISNKKESLSESQLKHDMYFVSEDNNEVPTCKSGKSSKNLCGLTRKLSQKSIAVQTVVLAQQAILCPYNIQDLYKRTSSCSSLKNKKSITPTRIKISHEKPSVQLCQSHIDTPHDSVEVKKLNSKKSTNVKLSTCLFTKTFASSGRPSSFEKRKNYDAFWRLQKDCKQLDLNCIGDETKFHSRDTILLDDKLSTDQQNLISNCSRSMKNHITSSNTIENKQEIIQKSAVNSKVQPFTKLEVLTNKTGKPFVQKQNEEKQVSTCISTAPVKTLAMAAENKEVDNPQNCETSTKKEKKQKGTFKFVEPEVYENFNNASVDKCDNYTETCTTQDKITEPQSLNESFNNASSILCNNNAKGANVITNGKYQTLITGPSLIEHSNSKNNLLNPNTLEYNTDSLIKEKLNLKKGSGIVLKENSGSQTSITLNSMHQQEINMKREFVVYNSTIKLNADKLQFNVEHVLPHYIQNIHSTESITNSLHNYDNLETSSLEADSGVSSCESKSSKPARQLLSFLKSPLNLTCKNGKYEKHSKKGKQNVGKEALKDSTNILEISPYVGHFFCTTNTMQNVFPTTNKCFILEEKRDNKANSDEKKNDSNVSEPTQNGEQSDVGERKGNSTPIQCTSKNCPYKTSKKPNSLALDALENSGPQQTYKKHCHCSKPTCFKCDKKPQQLEEFEKKTSKQDISKAKVSSLFLGHETEEQSKFMYDTQGGSSDSIKKKEQLEVNTKNVMRVGKQISQQGNASNRSSEETKALTENTTKQDIKERRCNCYKGFKDTGKLDKIRTKNSKEDLSPAPLPKPSDDESPKIIFDKLLATCEKEEDIVSRLAEDEEFFQSQLQLVDSNFAELQNSREENKTINTKEKVEVVQSPHISMPKSLEEICTCSVPFTDSNISNATAKKTILIAEMASHKSSVQEIVAPSSESLESEDQILTLEEFAAKAEDSFHTCPEKLSNTSKLGEEDMLAKFSTSLVEPSKQPSTGQSAEIVSNVGMKKDINPAVLQRETSTTSNTVHPADIGKCFLRGFRDDYVVLEGGQCLKISEQESEERAKRLLLKKQCLENMQDSATNDYMSFNSIDFSERDTPLEFLLALGFSIDEASNAIKDEDVKNRLNAAITEARVWVNKISKSQGTLIYLIAYKAKPETMHFFLLLVEAIINSRITNAVKLDGFLKALEKAEAHEIAASNVLGVYQFEDDENEEKIVKKQLSELFITVYQVAKEEATKTGNPLRSDSVQLLRTLVAKYRAGLQPHLELIARYIGQYLIVDEVQLEAAMVYLSSLDTADVHLKEFEMYCGIKCPKPEKK